MPTFKTSFLYSVTRCRTWMRSSALALVACLIASSSEAAAPAHLHFQKHDSALPGCVFQNQALAAVATAVAQPILRLRPNRKASVSRQTRFIQAFPRENIPPAQLKSFERTLARQTPYLVAFIVAWTIYPSLGREWIFLSALFIFMAYGAADTAENIHAHANADEAKARGVRASFSDRPDGSLRMQMSSQHEQEKPLNYPSVRRAGSLSSAKDFAKMALATSVALEITFLLTHHSFWFGRLTFLTAILIVLGLFVRENSQHVSHENPRNVQQLLIRMTVVLVIFIAILSLPQHFFWFDQCVFLLSSVISFFLASRTWISGVFSLSNSGAIFYRHLSKLRDHDAEVIFNLFRLASREEARIFLDWQATLEPKQWESVQASVEIRRMRESLADRLAQSVAEKIAGEAARELMTEIQLTAANAITPGRSNKRRSARESSINETVAKAVGLLKRTSPSSLRSWEKNGLRFIPSDRSEGTSAFNHNIENINEVAVAYDELANPTLLALVIIFQTEYLKSWRRLSSERVQVEDSVKKALADVFALVFELHFLIRYYKQLLLREKVSHRLVFLRSDDYSATIEFVRILIPEVAQELSFFSELLTDKKITFSEWESLNRRIHAVLQEAAHLKVGYWFKRSPSPESLAAA